MSLGAWRKSGPRDAHSKVLLISPDVIYAAHVGDCKVLEVLRDHSECLTEHEEIGA